ncbi:unnamed protein product [Tilletia laevis]|uniref:Mannose-P-dolichol utilization defect 1 protein homolog n=2 Tax=Tilletia TaxID=13289 RepID=A0A177VEB8_9BASI|nr:hypothetical protein CF336_g811 [Tilletia laevis]KAE8264470.1 hypothetical protein A4X03_0g928 [Tilletia caries]CAD6922426.1 unnamed protein product [Tilletia controversa]KAE8208014.1 hypothetical protein CF335_g717 [Tilletia laevis]CAD6884380.1 unnamed protein product [Tilletia caries]
MDLLRAITAHLPSPLVQLGTFLLGQDCYSVLVHDIDTADPIFPTCFRLGISKGLGLGIIAFGSIMKVPQILKITRARSARGISLAMYALEVLAYTVSLAYAIREELPFTAWGENLSLTVQNMVITLLIIYYAPLQSIKSLGGTSAPGQNLNKVTLAGTLMVVGVLFLSSQTLCPPHLLRFLQACTIPISLASKVPQMVELHTTRAPGQLSAIVVVAQLLGTIARVFTTLTETSDHLLLWGFSLATVFNAVIAVQLALYWNGNERIEAAANRDAVTGPGASASHPSIRLTGILADGKPGGGRKQD